MLWSDTLSLKYSETKRLAMPCESTGNILQKEMITPNKHLRLERCTCTHHFDFENVAQEIA